MNPVPFILLAISLPLLLGGCGEKHEVVNYNELEERKGITYLKNSDSPYTGKSYDLYENGKKGLESNYKDGKKIGETKYWNSKGEPVDSWEEAGK